MVANATTSTVKLCIALSPQAVSSPPALPKSSILSTSSTQETHTKTSPFLRLLQFPLHVHNRHNLHLLRNRQLRDQKARRQRRKRQRRQQRSILHHQRRMQGSTLSRVSRLMWDVRSSRRERGREEVCVFLLIVLLNFYEKMYAD